MAAEVRHPGREQGLASGLLASSAQIGTVLGLAVVVPLAAARTGALGGGDPAQVAGYELGFVVAAALALAAALAVGLAARRPAQARRRERMAAVATSARDGR